MLILSYWGKRRNVGSPRERSRIKFSNFCKIFPCRLAHALALPSDRVEIAGYPISLAIVYHFSVGAESWNEGQLHWGNQYYCQGPQFGSDRFSKPSSGRR